MKHTLIFTLHNTPFTYLWKNSKVGKWVINVFFVLFIYKQKEFGHCLLFNFHYELYKLLLNRIKVPLYIEIGGREGNGNRWGTQAVD